VEGDMMQVRNQLDEVKAGMTVSDASGQYIGIVVYVHHGAGHVDMNTVDLRDVREQMQRIMGSDTDFPLAVYTRLYEEGFVRVRHGRANRYFTPQQVDMIVGTQVMLRIAADDLLTG
jgi:hypothetical protein